MNPVHKLEVRLEHAPGAHERVGHLALHQRGVLFEYAPERDGRWRLSPPYDLTFAEGPGGEHTTSVAGEGRRPMWEHLAALVSIDERNARAILDEVRGALIRWPEEARAALLPDPTITAVSQRLAAVEAAAGLPRAAATSRAPRPAGRRARGT